VTGGAVRSWILGAPSPPPSEEARRRRSRRSSSSRRPSCEPVSSGSRPMISSTTCLLPYCVCGHHEYTRGGGSLLPVPSKLAARCSIRASSSTRPQRNLASIEKYVEGQGS
jgi:hypothetical protein